VQSYFKSEAFPSRKMKQLNVQSDR